MGSAIIKNLKPEFEPVAFVSVPSKFRSNHQIGVSSAFLYQKTGFCIISNFIFKKAKLKA